MIINFARHYMERHMQTAAPEFIAPKDLRTMTDDEIDLLLEGIRMKRMQSKVLYDQTMEIKQAAQAMKIETKLTKALDKLAKQIENIDKHIEKLEGAANEVRNYRIALGAQAL